MIRSSFRFTTMNVSRPPSIFSTRKENCRFLYLRAPSVHNNLLHSKTFTDISITHRLDLSADYSIPRHKQLRIPSCQQIGKSPSDEQCAVSHMINGWLKWEPIENPGFPRFFDFSVIRPRFLKVCFATKVIDLEKLHRKVNFPKC